MARVRGLWGKGHATPPASRASVSEDEAGLATLLLRDFEKAGLSWFWATDRDGKLEYISECVVEALDTDRERLLGRPLTELFELDNKESERTLPLILNGHKTFSDVLVQPSDCEGTHYWTISGRPQFDEDGNFAGYLGNGADITERCKSERETSRLAMSDPLTGLPNRRTLEETLARAIGPVSQAMRSCAVIMMDLDRFKQVNDTLGHPAGDELLRQVADRLRPLFEDCGQLGRLGGDEFQAVLPSLEDRGELAELARKMIAIVSQPFSIGGGRCLIGASAGITVAPHDGSSVEEITENADIALYAAKAGGRGRYRFYTSDLKEENQRRRQLEVDLRRALDDDEMELVYEPVIEVASNRVIALETDLVWKHREFGIVPRELFRSLAAKTGLEKNLTAWSLRQACADAVLWPGLVKVTVRVCSNMFAEKEFPSVVAQALTNAELAPERLQLKLAEAAVVDAGALAKDHFNALKLLGVRLILEDFGTGFSSFRNLCELPFDELKIDDSFIRSCCEEESRTVPVIKAMTDLARALGLTTIAEGVAAHDELDLLKERNVDSIQGPIYSDPMPSADVLDALASGVWTIEPSGPARYREERRTVLRKVGVIHEDYRYIVTMRNLSRTGCLIEGLLDVPVGTEFVVDFGKGEVAVASVRRSAGSMQGLEFELPLVDDGAGGLVTRNRLSKEALASAGLSGEGQRGLGSPKFAEVGSTLHKPAKRGDG